jgi:hypothetical protein
MDMFVPVESWKVPDIEFLEDVGFKTNGAYKLRMDNPPITIAYKKGDGFILQDESHNKTHTFRKFSEMARFLENYEQKWQNEPYTDE